MVDTIDTSDVSENLLMGEFYKLCDAGGSLIQIRTREVVRTSVILRKHLLAEPDNYTHTEWDAVNGFRSFTTENYIDGFIEGGGEDLVGALLSPLERLRDISSAVNAEPNKIHCFVYLDPDPFIRDNPYAISLLQQYASLLPSRNVCIILVTPYIDMSFLPMGTVLTVDMPTPTQHELEGYLRSLLDNMESGEEGGMEYDVSDEDLQLIATLGLGMTRHEFETHASLAIVQAPMDGLSCVTGEILMEGIRKGKTEVVKQSDILELFHTEKMEDVGGMQRLKDWINDRIESFSPEAREFGVKPPRGVAIVGVPGTGKSLVSKSLASALGVPLIRLDFGKIFSKFVGDSESRLRQALRMVETMDRLVLFADEIDKGLGGAGGSGDGGVSSRVLGTFLTWMQENKSNCLVVLTANRIESLPPELFRRGRLDAVFSIGLPSPSEREEVLEVHLRKRGRSISNYSKEDIALFKETSDGYIPAEIESAVNDGLTLAFHDKECDDLEMRHIIKALKDMVPMSVSHSEQVQSILEWARKNATPVSYPEEKKVVATITRRTNPRRQTTH